MKIDFFAPIRLTVLNKLPTDAVALLDRITDERFKIPPTLDFIHLMGQTTDNQSSVLDRAAYLVRDLACNRFTIMNEALSGYPGPKVWKEEIQKRILDMRHVIHELPFPILANNMKASNSYGEAVSVVNWAKTTKVKSIGVVAQPLHQLRSFLGMVKVRAQNYPELKIYNIIGLPLNWEEAVIHSQGIAQGTRADLLRQEIAKIFEYQTQGHLATYLEAHEYMNERDHRL